MPVQPTPPRLVVIDAGANIACGTAVLGAPVLWDALDLPATARRPAGVAMIVGGLAMLGGGLSGVEPSRSRLARATAVLNGIWGGLGLTAWRRSQRPVARVVLPVVATYDLAMGIGKLAAPAPTK